MKRFSLVTDVRACYKPCYRLIHVVTSHIEAISSKYLMTQLHAAIAKHMLMRLHTAIAKHMVTKLHRVPYHIEAISSKVVDDPVEPVHGVGMGLQV